MNRPANDLYTHALIKSLLVFMNMLEKCIIHFCHSADFSENIFFFFIGRIFDVTKYLFMGRFFRFFHIISNDLIKPLDEIIRIFEIEEHDIM